MRFAKSIILSFWNRKLHQRLIIRNKGGPAGWGLTTHGHCYHHHTFQTNERETQFLKTKSAYKENGIASVFPAGTSVRAQDSVLRVAAAGAVTASFSEIGSPRPKAGLSMEPRWPWSLGPFLEGGITGMSQYTGALKTFLFRLLVFNEEQVWAI